MEEPTTRYWCHVCAQEVNPVMEVELKCPHCDDGFVEEMGGLASGGERDVFDPDLGSDPTLSLWAPVLLGMMGNPRGRRRARRLVFDDEDNNDENDGSREDGETELVREIETIIRRRRRSSASILQLLQGIRAGMGSNLGNLETSRDGRRDGGGDGGERVILVNQFSQTIVLHGSSNDVTRRNPGTLTSLGDYFVGPGLDLLLQHLAENDPNRHGTPPAQKEAVEAMPTVKITGNINVQCSICLDELNAGEEAREMPCKHKFHGDCILPWLDVHSSCPVCRYQMPADESKADPEDLSRSGIIRRRRDRMRERESTRTSRSEVPIYGGSRGEMDGSGSSDYARQMGGGSTIPNAASVTSAGSDMDVRNGNVRRGFSLPWPFNGLFSSSSGSGSTPSSANGNDYGGSSS